MRVCGLLIVIMSAVVLVTSARAEGPLGFLEWAWGTPKETVVKEFIMPKCGDLAAKVSYCSRYMVGDIQTGLLFSFQPDDTLTGYYMTFNAGSYAKMRSVAVEKFGQPTTVETKQYTTGIGHHVSGEVLDWTWPNGTIAHLGQLCGKVTEACLFAQTKALTEWRRSDEEAKKAQRKKGF